MNSGGGVGNRLVRARPQLLALLGLHGSLTPEESAVPLFHVAARDNT